MPDIKIPVKAAPGLTLQEMKQFVRDHFEEFVNQQESEVALKNFSSDFLDHDEVTGVEVGPEAAMDLAVEEESHSSGYASLVRSLLEDGDLVGKCSNASKMKLGRRWKALFELRTLAFLVDSGRASPTTCHRC